MSGSRVVITIRGGIPECTEQPDGVEVIVHDYDISDYDVASNEANDCLKYDHDGVIYWEKTI